jgi:hemerythrin
VLLCFSILGDIPTFTQEHKRKHADVKEMKEGHRETKEHVNRELKELIAVHLWLLRHALSCVVAQ